MMIHTVRIIRVNLQSTVEILKNLNKNYSWMINLLWIGLNVSEGTKETAADKWQMKSIHNH